MTSSGAQVSKFTHDYDPNRNLIREIDSGETTNFTYDPGNELPCTFPGAAGSCGRTGTVTFDVMTDEVHRQGRMPALEELRGELLRVARSEAGRPAWVRRSGARILAGLSLVTAGVGVGIAAQFDRDQVPNESPVRPPGGPAATSAARGTYYASLAELIAKTELVMTGTVQEVVTGRVVPDDPEYPTGYLNTVLTVDEALKGAAPSGTIVVETLELAFGQPRAQNEWRTPGKRVLLFLSASSDQPAVFVLSNSGGGANYEQSAYIVEGGDVIATTNDEVARQVAGLSLEQVRQAVTHELRRSRNSAVSQGAR